MERRVTPGIEMMEATLDEGRRAYREGRGLAANPYGDGDPRRGYWRMGWFQARDYDPDP